METNEINSNKMMLSIPNNWIITPFSKAYSFLRTFPYSRDLLSTIKTNDKIKYLHYGDIHTQYSNRILNVSQKSGIPFLKDGIINIKEFEKDDFPKLKNGDLIIADASEDYEGLCDSTEIIAINNQKLISGLHTFATRPKDGLIAIGFSNYILKNDFVRKELRRIATGISVYGISKSNFSKVPIIIPPLPEQQKIAKILSTWDQAIEQSQKLIEQLKLRKKGLMQQLLTGKKRLPGFSGEWKDMKLGDYFTQRNETNKNSLPLLSVGLNGVYPQDDSVKKDTSNSDKSKYKRICVGDIGYNTMRMWQGRSALSSLEGIVSPAYTIVTPKKNADSLYFSYLFKLVEVVHMFYRHSQGLVSDTWQCRFKDFSLVKVECPPTIKEQEAIAIVLSSAEKEIKAQETYLAQLQIQKKGLMQQLLTGKKRVILDN